MLDWTILIANSLFIIGLNFATGFSYCTDDEMGQPYYGPHGIDKTSKSVLWFLRWQCEKLIGEYWTKPVFSCIPCMSSVWGSLGYLITMEEFNIIGLFVHIGIVAGIGTIINRYLYGKLY